MHTARLGPLPFPRRSNQKRYCLARSPYPSFLPFDVGRSMFDVRCSRGDVQGAIATPLPRQRHGGIFASLQLATSTREVFAALAARAAKRRRGIEGALSAHRATRAAVRVVLNYPEDVALRGAPIPPIFHSTLDVGRWTFDVEGGTAPPLQATSTLPVLSALAAGAAKI